MTIIGFHIQPGGQRALMWCDSEFYTDNVPSGHHSKMMINPFIGAVTVGAGLSSLSEVAFKQVYRAVNTDDLVGWLAEILRIESRRVDLEPGSTIALIAYSHSLRRLVGFTFRHDNNFVEQPTTSFSLPDRLDSLHPETPEDVIGVIERQMRRIKEIYPGAGNGMVTVADVRPDAITVRPLYDIGRGEFLRAPMQFRGKNI